MPDLAPATFTIRLTKENGQYNRRVTAPDGSEMTTELTLQGIEGHRPAIQQFRENGAGDPESFERLGDWLYGVLFDRPTERMLDSSFGKAQKRMCLRLQISTEELDWLPWEMMWDKSRGAYLATMSNLPLTRSLVRSRQPIRLPPKRERNLPLKVLVVAASPPGLPRQPIDLLLEGLDYHLATLQGRVKVTPLFEATLNKVTAAAQEYHDIVLFVGHGSGSNTQRPAQIFLHDDRNLQVQRGVSAAEFGTRINDKLPRMVFLAACQTSGGTPDGGIGFAQELLAVTDVPAIVAMQTFIDGGIARDLVGWFLRNVAHGEPVDVALAVARETLIRGGTVVPDVFSAVLYLQGTADVFEMNSEQDGIVAQDSRSVTRGDTTAQGAYIVRREGGKLKVVWNFSVIKNSRSGTGRGSMSLKLLDANATEIYVSDPTLTVGANPLRPSSQKEKSEEALVDQAYANIIFNVDVDIDTSGIS